MTKENLASYSLGTYVSILQVNISFCFAFFPVVVDFYAQTLISREFNSREKNVFLVISRHHGVGEVPG